ncbi:hypothetical protein HOY34_04120 [Xinfangfangia sp. D13-10-4-6]|uniref:GFA family protein n=1 Tax=Pseudogemmobacter hezensis TaxID=2737662 RepID=UPI0015517E1C|nr:GFA family protein [Pseudogemmobacter hezensis]NPD14385.1 hypothetical protein [Pseudogemmobacter hezensis]
MKDQVESKCPFGFGGGSAATETSGQPAAAPGEAYRHMGMTPGMNRDKLPELLREPIEEGAEGLATGRCLCGKVTFKIKQPVSMVFANHDATSRRRSGGVSLTIMLRATSTAFSGWGSLVNYQVSDREVSCFCRICGTPVLTRYLAPEAMTGMISLQVGVLDSTEGLRLAADISHDEKPDFYAFAGERRVINSTELEGMFSGPRG